MPENLTPTASTPSPAATPTPAPAATPTPSAAPTAAGPSGATTPTGKTYSEAEVQRMIQDRVKNSAEYREIVESLREAGYIDKSATAAEIKQALAQARADEAKQKGDPTEAIRLEAKSTARSEVLDAKIEMAAEKLAGDPLYSDIMDRLDEIRPMARLMGGDVKRAYRAVLGDEWEQRFTAKKEAELIANIEAKRGRSVESAEVGGEAQALGLTAEEINFAKRVFGITDLQEIKRLKSADDFGKYKGKK